MSMDAMLQNMNANWEAGKRKAGGVPEGVYIMRLDSCSIKPTKKDEPMIVR